MTNDLNKLLKNKVLNDWRLFWLISTPISIIMIIAMLRTDAWSGPAVASMIQLSVRWAVPWLYLAFAASSICILFPGALSRWLLRNRKIIGMCFAAAMGWQLFFILWLVTAYSDYYIGEVYVLRDAIEGVVGYVFLAAMTITSFKFARKQIKPKTWRLLHKTGIYFIWAYAFSVYWWEMFYYPDPVLIDYVFYGFGFLAWALRALAWRKKHLMQSERVTPGIRVSSVFKLMGASVVVFGLLAASFGLVWRQTAEDVLTGYAITAFPEKYLPYWPFEPFLPLLIIGMGIYMTAKFRIR